MRFELKAPTYLENKRTNELDLLKKGTILTGEKKGTKGAFVYSLKSKEGNDYEIFAEELELLKIEVIAEEKVQKETIVQTKMQFEERKSNQIIKEEEQIPNCNTFKLNQSVKLETETEEYKKRIIVSIKASMDLAVEYYKNKFEINFDEITKDKKLNTTILTHLQQYTIKLMESKGFKVELKGNIICFS